MDGKDIGLSYLDLYGHVVSTKIAHLMEVVMTQTDSDMGKKGDAEFPGRQRMHISLNVKNLRESLNFYRVFFNTNPVKVRTGYAKFDLHDPALNFSLNEHPEDTRSQGHFGIQVKNTRNVRELLERYQRVGFKMLTENGVECCYAEQTKIWVADPDGNRWEVFVTTAPDAEEGCGPDCICHQEFDRSYAMSS